MATKTVGWRLHFFNGNSTDIKGPTLSEALKSNGYTQEWFFKNCKYADRIQEQTAKPASDLRLAEA